jgi:hypothetical protein
MKNGFFKALGSLQPVLLAFAMSRSAIADEALAAKAVASVANLPAAAAAIGVNPSDENTFVAQPSVSQTTMQAACPETVGSPISSWIPSCGCGADGGCNFQWTPDRWCNIGAGFRGSFNSETEGAPASISNGFGKGGGNFFQIDNMQLYFNAQITKVVGVTAATEMSDATANQVRLLDGIVRLEFNDYVNLWVGRFRGPQDRSTIDGPFFNNAWDLPFVSSYYNIFEGRDDQAVYWGTYGGGQVKWMFGLLNGAGRIPQPGEVGAPNGNGNPELAMRVVFNLLDPEPGYYNRSSYMGDKNILALAFAGRTQNDAIGDAANQQNWSAWNLDFLFENKMSEWGSLTVEGAYYQYSALSLEGYTALAAHNANLSDPFATRGGTSGFVYVGWLMPREVDLCGLCGRFRPFVRYQKYDRDNLVAAALQGSPSEGTDVGVEFVIKKWDARIVNFWGNRDIVGQGWEQIYRTGVQMIF